MAVSSLRPGVFSSYTLSSFYGAGGGGKRAALLAPFAGEAALVETVGAGAAFLGGEALAALGLLLGQGAPGVYCVPLAADADDGAAKAAVASLASQENLYAVVCAPGVGALAGVREAVDSLSAGRRECVAFCGVAADGAAAAAIALNSERMVLCAPPARCAGLGESDPASALCSAAALAGAVLRTGDPAITLSGAVLEGLTALEPPPDDALVERLLAAGVTPLEIRGGAVECVRALTTRTATDGLPDRTFAPLGTILIVDDVMASLRASLAGLLRGARSTEASFGAVASQVIVLLQEKLDAGLLTSFGSPLVRQQADDPSICLVEVSFGVAYAVNQIHLRAQITV